MFDDAIGRREDAEDVIDATRLAQAAAMLGLGEDGEATARAQGAGLPPLFHLFFANNPSDAARIDQDGHEILGRFIPDVSKAGNFHRRMWAAGDMRFDGQMKSGERVKRQSIIRQIEAKEGKTGPLIFVTVDRLIESASGQVQEKRTIVYREAASTSAPDSIPLASDDTLTEREAWLPEPVQLFRFSALTWNGHRIHYDLQHCRETEHYPDLITHGPFTAMMLANLTPEGVAFIPAMRGEGAAITRFKFRSTQALFANRRVSLCLNDDGTQAEARNHHGQQAMTAIREG